MTTMQRWELSAFGRENLSLVSVPRPVPGADEVLVEGGVAQLPRQPNYGEPPGLACPIRVVHRIS